MGHCAPRGCGRHHPGGDDHPAQYRIYAGGWSACHGRSLCGHYSTRAVRHLHQFAPACFKPGCSHHRALGGNAGSVLLRLKIRCDCSLPWRLPCCPGCCFSCSGFFAWRFLPTFCPVQCWPVLSPAWASRCSQIRSEGHLESPMGEGAGSELKAVAVPDTGRHWAPRVILPKSSP